MVKYLYTRWLFTSIHDTSYGQSTVEKYSVHLLNGKLLMKEHNNDRFKLALHKILTMTLWMSRYIKRNLEGLYWRGKDGTLIYDMIFRILEKRVQQLHYLRLLFSYISSLINNIIDLGWKYIIIEKWIKNIYSNSKHRNKLDFTLVELPFIYFYTKICRINSLVKINDLS